MPFDNHNQHYENVGSGTNSQGNRYNNRDYGPNVRNRYCYNYTNADGSYYYTNPDGSTYYRDKKGNATYTPPPSDATTGVSAEYQRVSKEVEKSLLDVVETLHDDDSMISRRRLIEVLTGAAESLGRLSADAAGKATVTPPASPPRTTKSTDNGEGKKPKDGEGKKPKGGEGKKPKDGEGKKPEDGEGKKTKDDDKIESFLARLGVRDLERLVERDAEERSNARVSYPWLGPQPRTNARA